MRGDINFKVSDSGDLSVYFLFCDMVFKKPEADVKIFFILLHWVVPKKIRTPPTEEISAVRRGGGRDCLKNV